MSFEGGGDRDYVKKMLEQCDSYFDRGNKLDYTIAKNILQVFLSLYSLKDEKRKAPRYSEYAQGQHDEEPEVYELIMKRSDPEAVAALNNLVDEFNADFSRIVREKDEETLKKFVARGKQLVKEK